MTEIFTQNYFQRVRTKVQKSGENMKSAYANTTMPFAVIGLLMGIHTIWLQIILYDYSHVWGICVKMLSSYAETER